MNNREATRREKLLERSALTAEERETYSSIIQSKALDEILRVKPRLVHCYLSMRSEVMTDSLIHELHRSGIGVVVPIVEAGNPVLGHTLIKPGAELIAGPNGTSHPAPSPTVATDVVKALDIDVVLVPLAAFDRQGNRLGYGKGYYDRFLSSAPDALKIGLAFACQLSEIQAERHDVPLDLVITELEVINCNPKAGTT